MLSLLRMLLPATVNPVVGEVWMSENNGDREMVAAVEVSAEGATFVTVRGWIPEGHWCGAGPCWGVGMTFLLSEWRRHLRDQRRVPAPA